MQGGLPCGALDEARADFLQQYSDSYGYNGWMEQHWQQEVGNRIGQGQHYLDYTGVHRDVEQQQCTCQQLDVQH